MARRDASIGVNLIGRDVSASKALNSVGGSADQLGKKLVGVSDKIIKGMAMAAAAAGALAVKIGTDAVKAAAEDAKSVALLDKQLRNSVGATRAQIAAVEDYISVQQKRVGLDDGALRESFATLTRATGSITKSQQMMNDVLDIAALTGRDVSSVALTLAKAYNGNFGALTRLGISVDKTTLKTKDYNKIMTEVRKNTGGFADKEAATFEGRLRITRQRIDEVQESLGYLLLPYVERFATYLSTTAIPALEQWIEKNGPAISKAIKEDVVPAVESLIENLGKMTTWVTNNKDSLLSIGKWLLSGIVGVKVAQGVAGFIKLLAGIRTAYLLMAGAAGAAAVASSTATGGATAIAGIAAVTPVVAGLVAAGVSMGMFSGMGGGKPSPVPDKLSTGSLQGRLPSLLPSGGGSNIQQTTIVQGSVVTQNQLTRVLNSNLKQLDRRTGSYGPKVGAP